MNPKLAQALAGRPATRGARPETRDLFTVSNFERLPSRDLLEIAAWHEGLRELFHVKHKPNTKRGMILRYFFHVDHRPKWHNSATLAAAFTTPKTSFFIGHNYGQRLRELIADGIIESERDPKRSDKSHRYRIMPDLVDLFSEAWAMKRGDPDAD